MAAEAPTPMTEDVLRHLLCFRSLHVTLESAKRLASLTRHENTISCIVKLLSSLEPNTVNCVWQTDSMHVEGHHLVLFNYRILMPYHGQRYLEFVLVDSGTLDDCSNAIGRYTLDLSPFSPRKKSLAAKMKLKESQTENAGYLNVKVKMSTQAIEQPVGFPYVPPGTHGDTVALPAGQPTADASLVRSLHVLIMELRGLTEPVQPYVCAILGSQTLTSRTLRPCTRDTVFNSLLLSLTYHGERDCTIELRDKAFEHSDLLLASKTIDVAQLASQFPHEQELILHLNDTRDKSHVASGGTLRVLIGLSRTDVGQSMVREPGSELWRAMMANVDEHQRPAYRGVSDADRSDDGSPSDTSDNNDTWNSEFYRSATVPEEMWLATCRSLICILYYVEGQSDGQGCATIHVGLGTKNYRVPCTEDETTASVTRFDAQCSMDAPRMETLDEHDVMLGRRVLDLRPFVRRRANVFDGSAELMARHHGETRLGLVFFRLEKRSTSTDDMGVKRLCHSAL